MREFLFCMFYKTIGKFYIKIPNRLKWSSSDFKIGKKWALGKLHPNNSNLSFWDYVKKENDSLYIIHKINQLIDSEKEKI
jgi:hypothetical protein